MAEETASNQPTKQPEVSEEQAPASPQAEKPPKKAKPPAVEDKPFAEFIQKDFLPALSEGLAKQGIQNVKLVFEKQKIPVVGYTQLPECWQVIGRWRSDRKQPRQFNLYFFSEDIQGQRAFSHTESGGNPSTLEPFLIDERKINLDLLIFGTVQRLNAQKWLVRN
ncbi:MAG: DUF2996 domain-containing protein [Scytolyngbya sp. HA4215-MV1]|nr:DUF2996 domain-containing protein [Scytolyngbya sp. HA4215-MV1]